MKTETFADLIGWNRSLHQRLADCLAHCASEVEHVRAGWLLTYLADHEATLEQVVAGFERQADPKALNTWVYDYIGHMPVDPHRACDAPFATMSLEEISHSVLDLHNQVIDLYRYLMSHADIPEARELIESLLAMEEHETMLLAQQANRIRDM